MLIMPDPRYPVGTCTFTPFVNESERQTAIGEIRDLPKQLKAALDTLGEANLDSPYRHGGWTIRQLVHHIADSHMNAFIRFRLALTEDKPTIKPYDEHAWSLLPDSALPIEPSLAIIENVHLRLTVLLELTPTADFARELIHPVSGPMTLDKLLHLYAWHGRHHVAHITKAPR